MKRFLVIVALVFLVSCKSKAVAVEANKPTTRMNANKIIENYYNNKLEFSTLYIKSNVQYADDKQTQNVTAEIKIKKDQQILVSVRFLGITMAKASITPTLVSYYEKIGSTYFEGDFSSLSQWLGTDLDYSKIQNMLLGRTIDDLEKGKFVESFVDQIYRLDDASDNSVKKSFYFDANTFLVNKQEIIQAAQGRMIQVAYSEKMVYKEATLPSKIAINTVQKKGKTQINLDYNTITFNEALSFPYSVPNGYKRIIIK
jgi:opacity protein-like surface antigen